MADNQTAEAKARASLSDALRADKLLEGSSLLGQISGLSDSLRYKTDATYVSFDDHLLQLQASIDAIPAIALLESIPHAQGIRYENELLSALEAIQDQVEKVTIKVIKFQGNLARAKATILELSTTFVSWYIVAALDYLKEAGIKLPAQNIKALAASEFTRLSGFANLNLDTQLEAVKIELRRLDSKKKMAKQRFEMGREQVNASWSNRVPESLGASYAPPQFGLLTSPIEEAHDESAPSFVSRRTGEIVPSPRTALEVEDLAGDPTYDDHDYDYGDYEHSDLDEPFFKVGDAVPVEVIAAPPEEAALTPTPTNIGQYKAEARITDLATAEANNKQYGDWPNRFDEDANRLEAEGPASGVNPVLHQALIDASRSQAESLRSEAVHPAQPLPAQPLFEDEDHLDIPLAPVAAVPESPLTKKAAAFYLPSDFDDEP